MAVDVSALRKFQELWGPVLDSIPAVINAVSKQADMDRALQQSQRDLEAANAKVKAAKDEAANIHAKSADDAADLHAKMQAAIDAADRRAVSAEEDSQARINNAKDRAIAAEQKAAQQEAAVNAAQAQAQAKIAEAERLHAQAVATMNAEIRALEERKASVEAAIEALKSKLG